MNTEMSIVLSDVEMLQSLLENIPARLLPVEVVSGNGIVYTLSVIEARYADVPYEVIDTLSLQILDKENIGRYCSVNDHENTITLPCVTENWKQVDGVTSWTIVMYTLEAV
jgi:hypothetical protein